MVRTTPDLNWVLGFIESRGSFTQNTIKIKRETKTGLKKYEYTNPAFYLVNKDKSALEIAKACFGGGKIQEHGPVFHLEVRKKADVIRLVGLLEGKIRSERKIQEFERWKKMVLDWKSRAWGEGAEPSGG